MKKILILSFVLICSAYFYPQEMRQNAFKSLFSDEKANKIGDAITILVVESSQASNNAETQATRSSSLSLTAKGQAGKTALPGVDLGLGTNNDFTGSGSTKTTGLIRTKISATIDSVLKNGNLLVRGSRKIVINGEEQVVKIKGIVRSSDIAADNSVLSYNISEAEIEFSGSGLIERSQSPGWITKLFHILF
ncbi:MAG: flagellar basal body L-ring protein FlgH [Ignavibacteriaceae bacterium]|jgi:flagellar L-ring protein precursor FlgH|nr:flagellar basal body L-ring protein FlgH [Ignavibacteriaceae bacterium]